MKKLCTILAALTLVALCFVLMPAEAEAASTSDLTFKLNSDGESYYVSDCKSYASGSLTIPSTYNGKPVTRIGNSAFYDCTSLTSVTIPDSVTSIGEYAFKFCSNLTSVTIPDSVTSIGYYAFNYCTSLTSVTIPDSVTSIGSYAFYDCTGLTSVTIGDGVTSIGNFAFSYCRNLTSVTIPDSVTSIGWYAFSYCGSLTSVTIPGSVTSIGNDTFAGCTNLTSVTIPDSVTSIGSSAFQNCTSLTSVTIGNGVTSIGDDAFSGCTSLTSVTIPNSVTSIGSYAFANCDSLTSVTIGDGVTSIGSSAFENCTSLTSVTIPDSVTSIGDYAFYDCSSLTSVTIGDGVTSIGYRAFYYCESLTSVTIPDSVTSIGSAAFCCCDSLTSVTIPDSVTSIGNRAFSSCNSLTSVTIPDSVTSIGDYAFNNCTSLTSVIYCGTEEQWNQITIGSNNTYLLNAKRSYHAWVDATCITVGTCSACGETMGTFSDHTYDNDIDSICNICGHIRVQTATDLQFFSAPGLSFRDYIGMQIMLKNTVKTGYDKVYVEIAQVTPNGIVTITTEGVPYMKNYTVFEQQIVSWSMTEQVTMTLYGEKGGALYKGASFTTTVKDLAMNKISVYLADGDMVRCRALVDMLNYGAAVQTAYDYNATNLPNVDLGEYVELGTQDAPGITAENNITGTNTIKVYSANISLQDKVEFQFMVKTADIEGKLVVPMHNGVVVPVTYTTYGSYTIIRVAVAAANMRDTFKIAVYNTDGRPLTCIYKVSVEAYAKEMLSGAKADAYIAMMKYGDSVAAIA